LILPSKLTSARQSVALFPKLALVLIASPCSSDPLTSPLSAQTSGSKVSGSHNPLSAQQSPLLRPGGQSPLPRSGGQSPLPLHGLASPVPQIKESLPRDFSFLLRPEIYHPLSHLNVPAAFRNSSKQPVTATPLSDLLAKGHFRAAAIAAVQELTSSSPDSRPIDSSDHQRIFSLLYIRLACLTLIDATPLAAQEVKSLEDLNNASIYADALTGEHLVPWELRVLNVRLQALGFSDPRRSVMSYHDLAREAREQIAKAAEKHDNTAREMWKSRLHDLGIKVAGALIEMDDLSGAAHHLSTLRDRSDGKMATSKALLWLHVGDVAAARKSVGNIKSEEKHVERVVLALCEMAEGNYDEALRLWQELKEDVYDEMIGVNMAVCNLYLGRMDEVSTYIHVDTACFSNT
jgi:trafficking protein particle complex subunit 12